MCSFQRELANSVVILLAERFWTHQTDYASVSRFLVMRAVRGCGAGARVVTCRAFARAVVERGVCSRTAVSACSLIWCAERTFGARFWILERGGSSLGERGALGGGTALGRAPTTFFRLGKGLSLCCRRS